MERPPIGWCPPQNSRDPCRSNRPREKQMNRMRTAIAVLSAGLAVSVLPVTAAADTSLSAPQSVPPEVLAAMQRDLGLSADQVVTRVAQETRAAAAENTL